MKKSVLPTVRMGIVVFACLFLLLTALLATSGMEDDLHKVDVAVVLGNAVNRNGTPSRRLAARLDAAVELYRRGMFENVIVSGGMDPKGLNEASVMENYLVKQGIPKSSIIVDSLGINTAATAKNAAAIAKARHWSSVMVISQYFHIPRSRLAFSRVGFEHVYSAHAHYFELRDLYSTPREVIGYAAYLAGFRN